MNERLSVHSVDGVPTQVIRCTAPGADELVLVVPGNPGVARFYAPFAEHLFRLGAGRWSVAVASHAGHAPAHPPPEDGHFSLDAQIRHKLDFLDTLPPHQTIHLVGHSIGAWIALAVLDRLAESKRGRAVFICPTLERMAETPNGQRLSPLFGRYRRLGLGAARLIHGLPGRERLLRRVLLAKTPAEEKGTMLRAALDLSPPAINNVLGMADEEMRDVVALPEDLLRTHGPRLCLWYAPEDPWNLPGMAEAVAARGLGAEVVVGPSSLRHSFVLFGSREEAEFTAGRLSAGKAFHKRHQ